MVREYYGIGPDAELIAKLESLRREEQEEELAERRAERARLDALDVPLNRLYHETELLARAALMAAGFHQHKRGEWRKKRGKR